ncbi:MAG TPA: hypothetical protein VLM79_38315, partial [Kofleriaceae bacterium]|nr:hypothetical protein [Kofleriaceae bacterium]
VAVNCTTNEYVVNVSVIGLSGDGLVLQNNGGDDLPIASNGTVAFATAVASGANYDATVLSSPTCPPQICTITDGSGTIANANVTVQVECVDDALAVGGSLACLSARQR